MDSDQLQLAPPLYATALAVSGFLTVVIWRVFNKARRSGVLLLWIPLLAAAIPWVEDPEPWLILLAVSVSVLVALGIGVSMVSIIGRPIWWVLPVLVAGTPLVARAVWEVQASAFDSLPESFPTFAMACAVLSVALAVPIYLVGCQDLAAAFGHSGAFGVGLALVPFVFLPVLAFGPNRYGDWGGARRTTAKPAMEPGAGAAGASAVTPRATVSLPPLQAAATGTGAALTDQPLATPGAGWYADPDGSDGLRFWDGSSWTDRVEPGGQPAASP